MDDVVKKYEDVVIRHPKEVAMIENTLKSLSYLIPGRFHDSDFFAEFVYSSISLASLYHDSLFTKAAWNDPGGSLSNRYVSHYSQTFPLYKKAATILSVLKTLEVVLEMAAQRLLGKDRKWPLVFLIEACKAICRFILVSITQGKLLPDPPLPDANRQGDMFSGSVGGMTMTPEANVLTPLSFWKGAITERMYPSLATVKSTPQKDPQNSAALSFVVDRALISAKPPTELVSFSTTKFLSEILYIGRPLIYVLAIMKFGPKSWRAWILSFIIEWSSYKLLLMNKATMTPIEKDEHQKRALLLYYSFLRNPMYELVTRRVAEVFTESSIGKAPLINIATTSLKDYMHMWEEYYFYTSAS